MRLDNDFVGVTLNQPTRQRTAVLRLERVVLIFEPRFSGESNTGAKPGLIMRLEMALLNMGM